MVAADEEVPRAVKYAGIMFFRLRNGFLRTMVPAMLYWTISMMNETTIASTSTFENAESTSTSLPFMPRERNRPKM